MGIDRIGSLNLEYDAVILNRGAVISPTYQKTINGQVYYFKNSRAKVKAPLKVKLFNLTTQDIKTLENYAINQQVINYSFYNETGQGVIVNIDSSRVVSKLSERRSDLYNVVVEIKPIDTAYIGASA